MQLTIPVLEGWAWPWSVSTLHAVYLLSGLLIALNYIPQIERAWRLPAATLDAQSLPSWVMWTLCRVVALLYGVFVVHDLVFLIVVGADLCGRTAMVAMILRAHGIASSVTLNDVGLLPVPEIKP